MSLDVGCASPSYAMEEAGSRIDPNGSSRQGLLRPEAPRRSVAPGAGPVAVVFAPPDGRPPAVAAAVLSRSVASDDAMVRFAASVMTPGAAAADRAIAADPTTAPHISIPSPIPPVPTPWELAAVRRRDMTTATAAARAATPQPWVTAGVVGVVRYADAVIGRGASVGRHATVGIVGAGAAVPEYHAAIRRDAVATNRARPPAHAEHRARSHRPAPAGTVAGRRATRTVRVNPCVAYVHNGMVELGFRRFRHRRGDNDFHTVSLTAGAGLARTNTDIGDIFRRDSRLLDPQLLQQKYQPLAPVIALVHRMIAEEKVDIAWQILYNDNGTGRACGMFLSHRRPRAHMIMIAKVGTNGGRPRFMVFDPLADPGPRVRRHRWQWWRRRPTGTPMEIHTWVGHNVDPKNIAAGTGYGPVTRAWHVLFRAGDGAVPVPIPPEVSADDLPIGVPVTGVPTA